MFDLGEAEIEDMVGGPAHPPGDANDILSGILGETDAPALVSGANDPKDDPPPSTHPGASEIRTADLTPVQGQRQRTRYSWEDALDQHPRYKKLLLHHPSITELLDPDFGRVVVLGYLSDRKNKVHRNLKFGAFQFFDAPHIRTLVELDEPDYRIVVRAYPYMVGTVTRFWESHPSGDDPKMSVSVVLEQGGLRRVRRRP